MFMHNEISKQQADFRSEKRELKSPKEKKKRVFNFKKEFCLRCNHD